MNQLPSEDEFKAWLTDPVTQTYRRYLVAYQKSLKDQWAHGSFQSNDPMETAIANASAIALYQTFDELIELPYDSLIESLKDE